MKLKLVLLLPALFFAVAVLAQGPLNKGMKVSDKKIVKTKTINCSLDTAWWKWTTHEGLKTFFGEDNMMKLEPGGPFEIYFSMKEHPGVRGSEGCKVLSYLPKEMLSFSWNTPPKFDKLRNSGYHTWVVVTLKKVNDNQTEVTITHLGWPESEQWTPAYDYFTVAWDKVMEWLDKSCMH